MKRNRSRIWGRKTSTEEMPFHAPSSSSDCSHPAGRSGRARCPTLTRMSPNPSESGWPMEKTTSNTPMTTDEKEQRSPDAVEEDVVELAAVFSRQRSLIAGAAADLRGPGVGAGGIAEHGQSEGLPVRPGAVTD